MVVPGGNLSSQMEMLKTSPSYSKGGWWKVQIPANQLWDHFSSEMSISKYLVHCNKVKGQNTQLWGKKHEMTVISCQILQLIVFSMEMGFWSCCGVSATYCVKGGLIDIELLFLKKTAAFLHTTMLKTGEKWFCFTGLYSCTRTS